MTAGAPAAPRSELVPYRTRLRCLQLFRAAAMVLLAGAALAGAGRGLPHGSLVPLALGYAVATSALFWLWERRRERTTWFFTALLALDAVVLVWGVMGTGGLQGWLWPLLPAHLLLVSLLVSGRAGLRLAAWHSVVLVGAVAASDADIITGLPTAGAAPLWSTVGLMWLVTLLASQSAAVNERELRRSGRHLQQLASFAGQLEATTDPSVVAQLTVGAVTRTFSVPGAVLLDVRGGTAEVLATSAPIGRMEAVPVDELGLVDEVVRTRGPVHRRGLDPDRDGPLAGALDRTVHDATRLVALPLVAEGEIPAVLLVVEPDRGADTHRDLGALQRFAAHAALALNSAWLHDSLEERATTDGLTGLANRRTFDAALAEELARTDRTDEPMAVALLDLDHFKAINDEFGHPVGDEVLRRVAAALADLTRPFDVAARYGGEEFGLVLPGTDEDGAVAVGQRMRRAVAAVRAPVPVTASVGVVSTHRGTSTPEELVAAADMALYEAKRRGRDRVLSANDLREEQPAAHLDLAGTEVEIEASPEA